MIEVSHSQETENNEATKKSFVGKVMMMMLKMMESAILKIAHTN